MWTYLPLSFRKGASGPTGFELALEHETDASPPGALLSPKRVSKVKGVPRSLQQHADQGEMGKALLLFWSPGIISKLEGAN